MASALRLLRSNLLRALSPAALQCIQKMFGGCSDAAITLQYVYMPGKLDPVFFAFCGFLPCALFIGTFFGGTLMDWAG